MGLSPPGSSYNTNREGIPLLNGPTEFTDNHPIPQKYTINPTKICEKDDLLICVRGNTTGRMNWADQKYCIGRGLALIRPKKSCFNIKLLHYFLKYKTSQILARTTSGTFPNLSNEQLKTFPYLSLPEFEQIELLKSLESKMNKFKKISTLMNNLEKEWNQFDNFLMTLRYSILSKAFTGKLVI